MNSGYFGHMIPEGHQLFHVLQLSNSRTIVYKSSLGQTLHICSDASGFLRCSDDQGIRYVYSLQELLPWLMLCSCLCQHFDLPKAPGLEQSQRAPARVRE